MQSRILQINFKLNITTAEYEQMAAPLGDVFAGVEGLQWKIWLLNPPEHEAGGIYLFESDAAVDAYLAGPIVAQLKQAPFIRDLSVKRFEVMEDVTAVTRGPVRSEVAA